MSSKPLHKPTDAAAEETALAPLDAVAARVTDGGCLPEAWTLQLLPTTTLELVATLVPTLLVMGNFAVVTALGLSWVAMPAAFLYLGACWLAVVTPVHAALDGLTGASAPDPEARLRSLGAAYLWSLPLGLLQCAGVGLSAGLSARYFPDLGPPITLAVLLWFHVASTLMLVRRRLRPEEAWLYSLAAAHAQVLRFFPLGLLDVARDWATRARLGLGKYPGVPGQGTVHSRVGIAWAMDIGATTLAIAAGAAVSGFGAFHPLSQLAGIVVGSVAFALGAYLAGMNLAHAYAGYLTYAGGRLDAWLEAGATPPELPEGTGEPPPGPPADPSEAAGSEAG